MKKLFRFPFVVALLFALTIEAPIVLMESGCSSPGSTAHKSEVVAIPTVNVAMGQWATYVKSGKATQAQMDSVKSAYGDYYSAEVVAKSAETAWVNSKSAADQTTYTSAAADASTKAAGVVALITTYMTVK